MPALRRFVLDRAQQVLDHLVARRGDADLLPAAHEVADHRAAGVGLAGAGRALNREHRLAQLA